MRAEPDERVGDVRLDVTALEIEEEHVPPEALLAWPGLDAGEVHIAGGARDVDTSFTPAPASWLGSFDYSILGLDTPRRCR